MLKPDFSFDCWGLPIYNLMAAAGVLCALLLLLRCEKKEQLSVKAQEQLNIAGVSAAVFGLMCANVANWFFLYPESFQLPLLERIQQSGLTFYYGMFGFFASFAVFLRLQRLDVKFWVNQIVPSMLIFHAFGRIGCSLVGCCYGVEIEPALSFLGIDFHLFPARELEALSLFVLFFLFQFKIKERRFSLYLLSYSVIRFFLEFGRADERGFFFFEGLSPAQVTSIIVWVCLLIWFVVRIVLRARKRGEVLATTDCTDCTDCTKA